MRIVFYLLIKYIIVHISEDLNIHGIMHNREVDFYKWASQCPQSALSQFKMPKYYGGRYCDGCEERACSRNFVTHFIQEGILILEDFTHRMIGEIDFLGGFSLDLVIDSHLFQRCVYFPVKDIIRSIVGYQNVYLSAVEKVRLTSFFSINEISSVLGP